MTAFGAGVDATGQEAAAGLATGRGCFRARQLRVRCLSTGAGALAIVRALPTGAGVADLCMSCDGGSRTVGGRMTTFEHVNII